MDIREVSPRGLAWPLRIEDGDLAIAYGTQLVIDAIKQVVLTLPLERVYRPRYGVPDPVFSAAPTAAEIATAYKLAVESQVKAVSSASVEASVTDAGIVTVTISPSIEGRELSAISFQLAE